MKTTIKKGFLFASLLLFISAIWKPFSVSDLIIERFKAYRSIPIEKLYIHIDKPYYTSGEDLWFKVYLLNGHNLSPQVGSSVAYIELINSDNKIIERKNILVTDGSGAGDFQLAKELPTGVYTLRGYSNYMRNFDSAHFFQKKINIWGLKETKQEVSAIISSEIKDEGIHEVPVKMYFFPEGGDLVEGISSMVAFKTNQKIVGKIIDENDQEVLPIKSYKKGYGLFRHKPIAGKRYEAVIERENGRIERFPLPKAQKDGYVLEVKNTTKEDIYIKVLNSPNRSLEGVVLIAQMKGTIIARIEDFGDSGLSRLNKNNLEEGILQLTLFSAEDEPMCERLVYISNSSLNATVKVRSDKSNYSKRAAINLDISVADAQQKMLPADLSISVTNNALVQSDPSIENIKTYFLLNSDLGSTVVDPGTYFSNDPATNRRLLDLLMLTHGWRRFSWQKIMNKDLADIQYPAEDGFHIKGKLVRATGKKEPLAAKVSVMAMGDLPMLDEIKTRRDGRFQFSNMHFFDTTEIILQAVVPKVSKKLSRKKEEAGPRGFKNINIILENQTYPELSINSASPFHYEPDLIVGYITENQKINTIDSAYNFQVVDLDEVVIRGKRSLKSDPFYRPNTLYSNPSARIVVDSIVGFTQYNNILPLLRRVSGVEVFEYGVEAEVRIRGKKATLFLIDNVVVDIIAVQTLLPQDVHYIDVLKSGQQNVYGMRAGSDRNNEYELGPTNAGAIAIFTRQGFREPLPEEQPGVLKVQHPGYYKAREFQSPDYSEWVAGHEKPDFRTTIYWNPEVQCTQNGVTSILFYGTDSTGPYHVEIEGITRNGIPVRSTTTINLIE